MEFKEAMRAWKRMCDAQNECEICPCNENCLMNLGFENIGVFELEKTLEKWAEEHPERTRMDDFFEKFPKATRNEDGVPSVCARDIGYLSKCPSAPDNLVTCSDCWWRPLEEVEG